MTTQTTTWPSRSNASRFTSLPPPKTDAGRTRHHPQSFRKHGTLSSSSTTSRDFSDLPPEIVTKIGSSLSYQSLKAASLVCKPWCEALRPAREAMKYLNWGKQFKHGRGGFTADAGNALKMFLKAAELGSTKGMVDAGLVFWEKGDRDKAFELYRKAAEAGDRNAQCNLGIWYLQVKPPNPKEAVKWLYLASIQGNVRAQYQLAICLYQGSGAERNLKQAARWYLKAAEHGYVRAMYNVSLCYRHGEGLVQSHSRARKWMKWAADCGHSKAQYEHGLTLFSEGEKITALVYLELADRAGVREGRHLRDAIREQLSPTSRFSFMLKLENWRALPSAS
ncbi:F-box protein At1g70590 [Argentina anserina]|uniref:F-box protein At1g70590 n=1 Tax=Argentina anserina TaxID=57926 RepID=UPI002176358B|nr:F-box protein At1g70590 [Potentilla anserina]